MESALSAWSPDDSPAEVVAVHSWDDLEDLIHQYADENGDGPLRRVLQIAYAHQVQTVVIERRYVDVDWRSQHAAFYSTMFRRYPTVTHRLHFFTTPLGPELGEQDELQPAYLGYTVLRALPASPVGRTMIVPPPELNSPGAVVCLATERVELLGRYLTVRAMPFMSQDTDYLRCAHAAMWMVLQHAHLAHGLPRRTPAEIYETARGGMIVDRQLPSRGLSVTQMLQSLSTLGLSPARRTLPVAHTPDRAVTGLYATMCRQINSALPPLVTSTDHVWVVVGYSRHPSDGHGRLTLWRHDDARGPYLPITDPWHEPEPNHQPWQFAVLAMLPKLYLDAERAEIVARRHVQVLLSGPGMNTGEILRTAHDQDQISFRTFAMRSSLFKAALVRDDVPLTLRDLYRVTLMSKYVWVVEVVDRNARDAGQADVLGEVVLDSTLSQHAGVSEGVIALHLGETALAFGPEAREARRIQHLGSTPYGTAMRHHTPSS